MRKKQTGTDRKREHKSEQIGRLECRRVGINKKKKKDDEPRESREDNLCNMATQMGYRT